MSVRSSAIKLSWIDGVPVSPFITQERLQELKTYPLLPDDVFIATYPKSGTTWMQQIVRSIRCNGQVDQSVPLNVAIPWLERGDFACKVMGKYV